VILADTSAWIEFTRRTGSPVNHRLRDLVAADGQLAVTEPVVMEVLAGARNEATEHDLRRMFHRFEHLPFDIAADFDGAVRIFRRCREAGITPRGLIDCMICSVALRFDVAVLTADADFSRFAEVLALRIDPL
jgi:predicted nucleic acid-binding protein